jgi:hypothetical protein
MNEGLAEQCGQKTASIRNFIEKTIECPEIDRSFVVGVRSNLHRAAAPNNVQIHTSKKVSQAGEVLSDRWSVVGYGRLIRDRPRFRAEERRDHTVRLSCATKRA